jgi:hypothetical protein
LGPSLSVTLVRVNDWLSSLQNQEPDTNPNKITGKRSGSHRSDVIEQIALNLIGPATRAERRLLSKALQEALYYSINFEANLTLAEFKTRFLKYLHRYDGSAFIKRFLCLYIFNHVWSETSDLFRGVSGDTAAFEKHMRDVEKVCQQTVIPLWYTFNKSNKTLDAVAAVDLVTKIERSLRGE